MFRFAVGPPSEWESTSHRALISAYSVYNYYNIIAITLYDYRIAGNIGGELNLAVYIIYGII